jgi:hypothetical protein
MGQDYHILLARSIRIGFAARFMDGFSKAGLDTFAQYQKEQGGLTATICMSIEDQPARRAR